MSLFFFFSARRYGESILTVSLRGLNNMIPFAGCTVRAGSQIKLVWWGRKSIAGVQDSLLCSATKLGKKEKLFSSRVECCGGDASQKNGGAPRAREFSILITRSQTKRQEQGRRMKSRRVGSLTAFNSLSILFDLLQFYLLWLFLNYCYHDF